MSAAGSSPATRSASEGPVPHDSAHGPFGYGPFSVAPFCGSRVCVRLEEIQRAEIGRRHSLKDRRPLDPPLVLQLRAFKVSEHGKEEEVTVEETQSHGLLCKADLFKVPAPNQHGAGGCDAKKRRPKPRTSLPVNDSIVAYLQDEKPVMASSLCDSLLSGADIVQARGLELPDKERITVFVFGDLSVKEDGFFCLRLRAFDIFSRINITEDPPVLAETFSSRFQVFSTKHFPRLQPSTELTQRLKHNGFKVHVRDSVRTREPSRKAAHLPDDENISSESDQ